MASPLAFAPLNEQNREAKRRAILDATERVFSSKPFNLVSMRDIANEAGISHATIYRYFPDQQALFVEAFVRGIQDILDSIRECDPQDPVEAMTTVAELFVDFLFQNDHYFKMMSHFMLHGELGRDKVNRLNFTVRPLLDQFESLFRKLGVRKNTRLMAHCYFSSLNGILITFRDYPGRNREDVHRHIKRLSVMMAKLFAGGAGHWI